MGWSRKLEMNPTGGHALGNTRCKVQGQCIGFSRKIQENPTGRTTHVEDGNEDFGKCMENTRENELGTEMCYG